MKVTILAVAACVFTSMMTSTAQQAVAEPCSETKLSRNIKKDLKTWQSHLDKLQRGYTSGKYETHKQRVEDSIPEIDAALLRPEINCFDHARLQQMGLEMRSVSDNTDISIPALEALLKTAYSGDGQRARYLRRLMGAYRSSRSFAKLYNLTAAELGQAPRDLVLEIFRAHIISLIGLQLDADALQQSDSLIKNASGSATRTDLLIAISLAERLGDADRLEHFSSIAEAKFGELRWPRALPGISGDRLNIVFEREVSPVYRAEVIKPPIPRYPDRAANRGIQGTCEVVYDTDLEGSPTNITAFCSDPVFVDSAESSFRKVKVKPLTVDGVDYAWTDVPYPLEYTLAN